MNGRVVVARSVAVLLALALLAICVRLAWLGDDGYITLRSVENWVSGHGLRWNAADRVQTFTHPLWMLLLAAGRLIAGESYFTTIGLGLLLTTTAIVLLLWRARTAAGAAALAAVLAMARAFPEYATSGLETSLTYLLLVLFVAAVADERAPPARRYGRAVLLATLAATNRLDLALLCAPAVLATMRGVPFGTLLRRGLLGALPLLAWFAFAALWFGSPFPVTAHAKAFGTGIPAAAMAAQGLYFVGHTLVDDPVLVLTVLAGAAVARATARGGWLFLGCALYGAYVVKVGGDFMAGRFFLPPFAVAAAMLARWLAEARAGTVGLVAAAALALGLLHGLPIWTKPPSAETRPSLAAIEAARGIVDERGMHYQTLGLLAPGRQIPASGALHRLAWPTGRDRPWFLLNGSVGTAGFGAGPLGHLVDPLLCDPLLARLPAIDLAHWRIGHVLRRIPEGYWETLAFGENRLRHPGLRRYYDALHLAIAAPVFAGERLRALWSLWRGELDADLAAFVAEEYRDPPRLVVPHERLPAPLPLGTFWFDEPRLVLVYQGGLAIPFGAAQQARELRLQALGFVRFHLHFRRGGAAIGEADAELLPPPPAAGLTPFQSALGLGDLRVVVPDAAVGFDEVWLDALEVPNSDKATGPPAIGALTVVR